MNKQAHDRLKRLFSDPNGKIAPAHETHPPVNLKYGGKTKNNDLSKGNYIMALGKVEQNPENTDVNEIQEIGRYVSLLWRWAWLIALAGGIAAFLAYLICQKLPLVYQTSTSLLILNAPYNQVQDYGSVQASQSLTGTYADILTDESVLNEVITQLGLPTTSTLLSKSIKVSPVRSSQMVVINVNGTDKKMITDIANTLVAVSIDKISSLQADRFTSTKGNLKQELEKLDTLIQDTTTAEETTQDPAEKVRLDAKLDQYRQLYEGMLANYEQTRLAEIQSTSNVIQISPAGLSYTRVSPKVLIITLLAGFMAMVLVAGYVMIRDALDHTLKTAEEITQKLKLPVLGEIYKFKVTGSPIVKANPSSPVTEAFRLLSTNIQYANTEQPARTILVTSPIKAEGKSTISVNLAITLAQAGNSVTLIDADFHHPVIQKRLHLPHNSGLADLLLLGQSNLSAKSILQKADCENLHVIASGAYPMDNKGPVLFKNFANILDELTVDHKFVIIDTPPVLLVTDPVILSTLVDGILLVIQPNQTTLSEAKQVIQTFQRVNARIIGVVLNKVDNKIPRYNRYFQKGESKLQSAFYPALSKKMRRFGSEAEMR